MSSNEWREVKLGEIVDIEMGQSPKSEFYNTEGLGVPFLQGNKTFGMIYPKFDVFCTNVKKIAIQNDILMSVRAPVGDLNIAQEKICIGRGICAMRMKNRNNLYLFYLLKHNVKNLKKTESGTVFGGVNKKDIMGLSVMWTPNLQEQKTIAATLSCLDDKIELNNRINKTLEEMAQAIFKSWFVDFEPFQNGEFIDSELGKIPKGWRVSSLDSIACYMNGIAMQKYKPEAEEFLPVIKIKELNQGFTDNNSDKASINIPEQHIIRNGDVLFSWSGTLLVKIWAGDIGGLNQHLFKVTSENYDKWFYYLWTLNYLDKFRAIAEDKATTMGHIKRKHLSEAMVLIPKFSDMNYMSNIMNPVIDKITELNSQNSCIRLIRDALLPKLMSGEVRVPIEEVL